MTLQEEYDLGYNAGLADGKIVICPLNTNGNTPEFFRIVRERYLDAIYALPENKYKQGYGDGFDAAAEERTTALVEKGS